MIDLLRGRRSIRKYKAREIEVEKIEILKEALLCSPSSMNSKPWEFIFVDDHYCPKVKRINSTGCWSIPLDLCRLFLQVTVK